MPEQIRELRQRYRQMILDLQGDLTGAQYAKRLGIDAPRLSRLRSQGDTYGFSLEQLMALVLAAGGEL